MISIRLMGGLGNQMFQYALGRHLSMKNNTTLNLDLSFLLDRTPKPNFTYRNYDLDIFNIKPNISISDVSSTGEEYRPQKYYDIFKNLFLKKIQERNFNFDKEILNVSDNSLLIGYWQSEKYFKDIESTIRNDFMINVQPDLNLYNQISDSESICLNVRRGDFVSNPVTNAHHGVCGNEYFYKAIDQMKKYTERPTIFVFSDDIPWCKTNLTFYDPAVFVTHDYAGKKFEKYLKLMSSCKYFIIPNSTFGWWAAWLCSYQNKKVIVPKNWFNNPSIKTDDLIPDQWLKI